MNIAILEVFSMKITIEPKLKTIGLTFEVNHMILKAELEKYYITEANAWYDNGRIPSGTSPTR